MHTRQFVRLLLATPVLFTTLMLAHALRAQTVHFSQSERHVIELADHRAPVDSIVPFLASSEQDVAWRAAIGLANLGEPAARTSLLQRLKLEQRDEVRDAIGFALGMLGPDSIAFTNLVTAALQHPSRELYEALGRTVTAARLPEFIKILQKSEERKIAPTVFSAIALMRLSMRKIASDQTFALLDQLSMSDDPEVRWRAAYAYAATGDSVRIGQRLKAIADLAQDQGSANVRMFAANALGRVHNPEARVAILKAFRSEQEWRVRVNLINALAALPVLDSVILGVYEQTIDESTDADPLSANQATAAIEAIERMFRAGKVKSASDSSSLREWLHSYAPDAELHATVPLLVRSMTLPIIARMGTHDISSEIADFNAFHDLYVRATAIRASGLVADTGIFLALLQSVSQSGPFDQFVRLEALDSIWVRAKKLPALLHELEEKRYANAYRYMLIRISDLVEDPAVVTTALGQIEDTLIVKDSVFHAEAETYVLKYLTRYDDARFHDQLLAAVDAAKWLKPKSEAIPKRLEELYSDADKKGWTDVRDSIELALRAIGRPVALTLRSSQHYAPIDWSYLENAPDTLLISTEKGLLLIDLDKKQAPLTVLNILKLAQIGYFGHTLFHRVVPNFVIQSGDPTMTGDGGPGYAIRTEVGTVEYDKPGAIGMASSGKDTEGSQWFITHCPTPHLDGRYTIFGRVVRGMELVDMAQLGSKVENIMSLKMH